MKNNVIALGLVLIGGLLVYSGLKNKHPIDIIKLALTGKDLNTARPISLTTSVTV